MAAGDIKIPTAYTQILGSQSTNWREIGGTTGGDLYTFAHRTITSQSDNTFNDSDKSFTVPAGRLWWLHSILVRLTSSAVAGSRRMLVTVLPDAVNDSYHLSSAVVQIENLSHRYSFFPGITRDTVVNNDQVMIPLPPRMLIPAAGIVRVRDSAAIDPTADDMLITLLYDEITV